ncbi:TetR family transcriptional regulator [Aquabacter sp. L1I39]|uniref:TetR/AcrR family transcriptional regulator n=1 Tax=Aquabacter sp. L1I39 TaxID=2820278 RepID=UPI001ADBCC43|nr:TetR/AcrR family transcriptional regulator [Aquabacter sp. L1I39]QTL05022.1 TetR family transcriptional regulator [Aquabacter sp. L1I39]
MADGKARVMRSEGAGPAELLDAAAACFMEQGFAATSIDDVARRLNATKGRIYHYYASKTDLFFDVHREGMDRLFVAVARAAQTAEEPAGARLAAMLEAHAVAMMDNHAFMAVVVQGVHMHRMAPTTPGQRRTLDALMDMRRRFEGLFREALDAAIADGSARPCTPSVAVKAMLGAINWMSIWYRPRAGETEADRRALAAEMVRQIRVGFEP